MAEKLRGVDLGHGDFHAGRQFVPYGGRFIGADIVEDLLKKHKGTRHAKKPQGLIRKLFLPTLD